MAERDNTYRQRLIRATTIVDLYWSKHKSPQGSEISDALADLAVRCHDGGLSFTALAAAAQDVAEREARLAARSNPT